MIENILRNYPTEDISSLIPLLHDMQYECGFLREDILREASECVSISFATLCGVGTFYNQFRLTSLGKYIVRGSKSTAGLVKTQPKF